LLNAFAASSGELVNAAPRAELSNDFTRGEKCCPLLAGIVS
jgi:hypothetical protein